jgi:hypothetical protein
MELFDELKHIQMLGDSNFNHGKEIIVDAALKIKQKIEEQSRKGARLFEVKNKTTEEDDKEEQDHYSDDDFSNAIKGKSVETGRGRGRSKVTKDITESMTAGRGRGRGRGKPISRELEISKSNSASLNSSIKISSDSLSNSSSVLKYLPSFESKSNPNSVSNIKKDEHEGIRDSYAEDKFLKSREISKDDSTMNQKAYICDPNENNNRKVPQSKVQKV